MKRCFMIIVFLLMPFGASAGQIDGVSVNSKAPEFTLQDQYDKTFSLGQFTGRIVVLVASDREGRVQNPAWKRNLKERYGDRITVRGVADVSSAPFFMKGTIREIMRKEGESILMDWKGEVFKAYALKPKVSNIVLINGSGVIAFLHAGPADTDALQELVTAIDRALREAR